MFSRINLSLTNYKIYENAVILNNPDLTILEQIYKEYYNYKKFERHIPFLVQDYSASNIDIIGYFDDKELVAYSLIIKFPNLKKAKAEQFAWNYKNPKLRLGIKSLEHECAYYKNLGYEFLYLGEQSEYKAKFQGHEITLSETPIYDLI